MERAAISSELRLVEPRVEGPPKPQDLRHSSEQAFETPAPQAPQAERQRKGISESRHQERAGEMDPHRPWGEAGTGNRESETGDRERGIVQSVLPFRFPVPCSGSNWKTAALLRHAASALPSPASGRTDGQRSRFLGSAPASSWPFCFHSVSPRVLARVLSSAATSSVPPRDMRDLARW